MSAACTIRPAHHDEMDRVRDLFREYQAHLNIDLCFQSFEQELVELPGRYAPPSGAVLFEEVDGDIAGVVAMRALDPHTAEMKRLFVRPAFHGGGLGRALAEAVIEEARRRGYARLRLDTLPVMGRAIELYRKLDFVEIEPYTHNPIAGALYLELLLT
ncbi:MAG: GNAT family N-acetyltransferase [Acidobacteria bacterium]|nr:GNAT family N-acetyltransferase [Acidobacteriota bacterium]